MPPPPPFPRPVPCPPESVTRVGTWNFFMGLPPPFTPWFSGWLDPQSSPAPLSRGLGPSRLVRKPCGPHPAHASWLSGPQIVTLQAKQVLKEVPHLLLLLLMWWLLLLLAVHGTRRA